MVYASASASLEAKYKGDVHSVEGNEKRYQYKKMSRDKTIGATKKVLDKISPVKRKSPPTRYWKTDRWVNYAGAGGSVLGAYGLYQSAENISNAENPAKQAVIEAGGRSRCRC
jgi:hypothetical protein